MTPLAPLSFRFHKEGSDTKDTTGVVVTQSRVEGRLSGVVGSLSRRTTCRDREFESVEVEEREEGRRTIIVKGCQRLETRQNGKRRTEESGVQRTY